MPELPYPPRRRRRRDPLSSEEMLSRFRRRTGRGPAGEVGAAAAAWPGVVGPAVADHTVPVRRSRAGMLTVVCSSAAWAQELTMRREELVEMLARAAPDAAVTGLRFSVADHVPSAAPVTAKPPPRPAPRPEDRALGEDAAADVADPALRALVARAAAASAARRRGA